MNRSNFLQTNLFGAIAALLLPFSFSSCDTLDFGYVNKLSHPITIVEHSWDPPRRMTLQPGQVAPPGFGHVPETIDVLRANGQLLARYRTRDIARTGPRSGISYVVIGPKGAIIERKEHFEDAESGTISR
ncbi:MAG TPA: hypothetical protein VGQ95_03860 [Chthoniobacterales bacterium]|nr:hypothetical protein [Chthoniobacterales bacterium]